MEPGGWAVRGKIALLGGFAALYALPSSAQVAAPPPGTSATPTPQPDTDTGRVQDIVVTAQRREQSLQKVPISVNTFNAAALSALNARTIGDLDNFTPGLTINDTSVTQPSYTIRGVATDDFGIGTEPSVGIFIDGIYSGRSGASLIFLNDIQRVEVLKGPQGTLFGRNTSAGAISIITNKPSATPEMRATAEFGNYGQARLDVVGNTPITHNLFLRIDGVINRRNGYLKDAITHEDREQENSSSARFALRWEPTDTTDFVLAYDHDDTRKDGPAAIGINKFVTIGKGDPYGPFSNDVIGNKETRLLNDVTLTATQHAGSLTFTSLSSYKHFATHNREDEDGTNDPTRYLDTENIEHNSTLYQELRAGFDNDRLNAIAGVSYSHERGTQVSAVTALSDSVNRLISDATGGTFPIFSILNGVGLPVFGQQYEEDFYGRAANDSFAAFGDATYKLTPRFSVTAGIRYTRDLKKFTWSNGGFDGHGLETITAPGRVYNAILGAPVFPAATQISAADFFRATIGASGIIFDEGALEGVPFTRRAVFSDVSPRFVAQYDATSDIHLYASASHGYKAGGFNSLQINSLFQPEHVWNFEGGVKSELFDHRVRLNLSGYYFKYRDRQSISLISVVGSAVPQYQTVSGDSRAYGLDLDSQFVLSRDFSLSATAGLIDSIWTKRIEQVSGVNYDISGQPTGEPTFRGILGAHYKHDTGHGTVFGDVSYSYTSRQRSNDSTRATDASFVDANGVYYVDPAVLRAVREPRNIVDAKIGFRFPGDRFTIAAYAENLLNKKYLRTLSTITTDIFNTPYVRRDRPGFYGVELGVKF